MKMKINIKIAMSKSKNKTSRHGLKHFGKISDITYKKGGKLC